MEKTRNERQTLWDTYANRALRNATSHFCSGKGMNFFAEPNDTRAVQPIKMLKEMIAPCPEGGCRTHRAFRLAFQKMAHFYTGHAAETLVLHKDSAFVCVRVENDLMYVSVHPWDLPSVKAHAREHNLFYDMRNVELLYLKGKNEEAMKNVVIASF